MTDEEREGTITRDTPQTDTATAAGGPEPADELSPADRAADAFVALEGELQGVNGRVDRLSGIAEDVERIPLTAVPDGYPLSITTDQALRLTVRSSQLPADADDLDDAVYVEWPPSDEGPLARLMGLRDIAPDRFADLHGKRIPLRIEDGFLVPRLPPASPRGSPAGQYGILAGLVTNLGLLGAIAFGLASLTSLPVVLALALVNLVVLPLATYMDAWHLLTTTDWKGGPPFWATLAMLPGVNVLSSLVYLTRRRSVRPL